MKSVFSHNQRMKWVFISLIICLSGASILAQASDWKAIPEAVEEKPLVSEMPVQNEIETEEEPPTPAGAQLVSGVVRFTRAMPGTEIFIQDVKDSVFIPDNKKHNSIFEACELSRKNKTPVQLIVDTKSRQVLRLATEKEVQAEAAAKSQATAAASEASSTQSKSNSNAKKKSNTGASSSSK